MDFKCDYGANFVAKLCYAVANGLYEWWVNANHSCRYIDAKNSVPVQNSAISWRYV